MKTQLTKLLMVVTLMGASAHVHPQRVSSIELKSGRAAGNAMETKLKKAPRRIYINEFRVFYQLVYVDQEQTVEGVHHGSTKATLKVGLEGANADSLKVVTNRLYNEYVKHLRSQNFTIISTNEASKIKQFENYQRIKGGGISSSQLHGFAMATPEGTEFLVKRISKKGKQKSGLLDKRAKISGQLDGAVVVNVNLVVPFMQESESKGSKMLTKAVGGVSKVVASTNMRVAHDFPGIACYASYFHLSKATHVVLNLPMKHDLAIEDVLEPTKFKAVASAQQNEKRDYGAISLVFTEHVDASNLQMIKLNAKRYYRGVYLGCAKYLDVSTMEFLRLIEGNKK